ncbi:SHOCT domain-containing protein [Lactobacillus xujianguonis]|uniref:SHOCT domain-containing protein n=1 Tax=Lactobacillus xujianguonis TaxID=2495899 RepID=A0A437SV89_9LACO|nr:SHOCT domain-containing protein [Lactobacillus xujianguonis]RVU72060.1 SHOCT domain-containing protein [Lactobacillus xujianguonis]
MFGGKLELNTVSGPQHNGGLGGLDPTTAFTAYGSATAVPFRNGKNKEMAELKDFIQNKIDEAHKPQPAQQINTTNPADEIAKLKKLADEGTITQEEFEAKKKQLLDL